MKTMHNNSNRSFFVLGIFSLFIATVCFFSRTLPYALIDALPYYGFVTSEEKNAFVYLLEQSSIIDQTLEKTFPPRATEQELVNDIAFMIQETQQKFVKRNFTTQNTQERWEIKIEEQNTKTQPKLLETLKQVGVIDAIKPKNQTTDAICVFGSTGPTMKKRIEYAYDLIQAGLKTKCIILLAGERYVTQDIDGTKEELIAIADACGLSDWTKLTETDVMKYHYQNSKLSTCDLPVFIIDTPRRDKPRPTTETTVAEMIEWLKKDHSEIKDIIFISDQPYVRYQEAMVELLFTKYSVNITYQVVGAQATQTDISKTIAKGLEGLGSFLWTNTPMVLLKMGIKSSSQAILDAYAHSPLMSTFFKTHVFLQKPNSIH